MEIQNTPPTDATKMAALQKKLTAETRFKNGVNWFFWIAGLSIVNSIIFLLGSSLTFVIGLGITQVVDGVMYGVASQLGESGLIARLIGFIIDIFISGVIVLFGVLGRKRLRWAIILGAVLYAIDGVILLLFKDYLGAAFHAWALIGIFGSLRWLKEIKAFEQPGQASVIEFLP